MKTKLLAGVSAVSILILGGCASTRSEKARAPAAAKTDAAKPLTANDLFIRFGKLAFGKDGVPKHTSITQKGTLAIEQFGVDGSFVRYAMAPDSNVTNIEVMGMTISSGCHKGVCWAQQPGSSPAVLNGDAAAMLLQQSDYNQWNHMERYYTSMEIVESPGPNHKVKAVKKNGDTDFYDFSKESGLLVSAMLEGETGQGRMKIGIQFNNYKDFDGMLMPTELIQATPQATIKLNYSETSFAPIPADKFGKPD